MVMTTQEVRRQLKIIAAVTGSTMKDASSGWCPKNLNAWFLSRIGR